jgi:hypothetical protein
MGKIQYEFGGKNEREKNESRSEVGVGLLYRAQVRLKSDYNGRDIDTLKKSE